MHASKQFIIATLMLAAACGAAAQTPEVKARLRALKPADFPARAIEFSVGAPAGGGMDITARLVAQKFQDYTGEAAVVNNRGGASGLIFNRWLTTQAPNDGHAIGVADNRIVTDSLLRSEGKWSYRDLDNLAFINFEPVAWITSSSGRYQTLADVVKAASAESGSVRVATLSGTFIDMLVDQVERTSNVKFNRIPFNGGAPALHALLGGHIDVSFGFVGEFKSHADKVRAIAVASRQPVDTLPGVATFDASLKSDNMQWVIWRFITAPKGMPAPRKAWLTAALAEVLRDPQLAEELAKRGGNRDPRLDSPERIAAELERMAEHERGLYLRTGQLKP